MFSKQTLTVMLVIATIIIFVLSFGQIDHSKEKRAEDEEKSPDSSGDHRTKSEVQTDHNSDERRDSEISRKKERLLAVKVEIEELLSRKKKLERMVDIGFFITRLLGVLIWIGINGLFYILSGAESFNNLLPFNGFLALGAGAILFVYSKSMTSVKDTFRALNKRISRHVYRKDQDLEEQIERLTSEKEKLEIYLHQSKTSKLEIA